MKNYEVLIFDLDDTLINNTMSMKYAFRIILSHLGIEYCEDLFKKWSEFDVSYWHLWESGRMNIPNFIQTREDKITYLRANRFLCFFESLGLDFETAVSLNELYCEMLGVHILEIEGAFHLLQDLHPHYEIAIATNGPKNAALKKLQMAKLKDYISLVVSSEEVGFSKPMPEFFYYLFDKIKVKDKNKMLLIGDSLTTDILGGMSSGIDTCWFNPNDIILPKEYSPTMTIRKLPQLKEKIKA